MRKYFDHAFEALCNVVQPISDCAAEAAKVIVVYVTIPLWIVPYMVYRKIEERKSKQ